MGSLCSSAALALPLPCCQEGLVDHEEVAVSKRPPSLANPQEASADPVARLLGRKAREDSGRAAASSSSEGASGTTAGPERASRDEPVQGHRCVAHRQDAFAAPAPAPRLQAEDSGHVLQRERDSRQFDSRDRERERERAAAAAAAPAAQLEPQEEVREQVAEAIRTCRWVEAQRKLRGLEARGGAAATAGLLSGNLKERLPRVTARYEASLGELVAPEDGTWEHELCEGEGEAEGLDFAYRLASSSLQVVASAVFHGADALLAFVGLCEYDLCAKQINEALLVEPIGPIEVGDALWHMTKRASVGKEDNILHVSYLDALDESLGALWVSAYVPAEFDDPACGTGFPAKVGGVAVPFPREGSVRLAFGRTVYAITPLRGEAGSAAPPGFRLSFGLCRRPSAARCILPRFMRREVEGLFAGFRRLLDDSYDVQRRMVFSRNADLYDNVRRRLAEKAPPALSVAPPPSGPAAPPPPAAAPTGPRKTPTLAELSPQLPEDWADYCEPVPAFSR